MQFRRVDDFVPYAFYGMTVEEFMADKTFYLMRCARLAEDDTKILWYEGLAWIDGKVKYVEVDAAEVPAP